jgi:hypothetical protein
VEYLGTANTTPPRLHPILQLYPALSHHHQSNTHRSV